MRKLNTIILIALYFSIQVGAVAWDYYKPVLHLVCNRLMQHSHESGKLVTIKTDRTTFNHCLQEDDELLWQGVLYDIENTTVNGNQVIALVEKDEAENKWTGIYNSICQHNTAGRQPYSPLHINCYKWMFKLYVPAENVNTSPAIKLIEAQHAVLPARRLAAFFPDDPCQPPDNC